MGRIVVTQSSFPLENAAELLWTSKRKDIFSVSLGYRTVITRQLPRALQLAQSQLHPTCGY